MIQRFITYLQLNNLISPGDTVCAGLSGGPDSVCLFVLLHQAKELLPFELRAFHVNHHLRGAESDADEEFVRNLCRNYHIPLYCFEHDVKKYAEENNCGTEEAGRILRQRDAQECLKNGCTKIAFAHHQNDQAETILFNLARGCSLSGLTGIRPAAGPVIHPMLCFSRDEITAYLQEMNISWRTDSTNTDTVYTRNYIRHTILHAFTEGVNPATVSHLASLAEDMTHVADLMDKITGRAYQAHTVCSDSQIRIKKSILSEDDFILRNVIAKCIHLLSGKFKDVSRKHLDLAVQLYHSQTGTTISLPFDLEAANDYGDLILRKKHTVSELEVPFIPCKPIQIGEQLITSDFIENPKDYINKKNKYTKCFDYDKITDSCVIRTRKPGDRICLTRDGGSKKLKDYFIDIKMSREERDTVLLLATGNLVHWVMGYRMGESAKITESTNRSIRISLEGKNENEC